MCLIGDFLLKEMNICGLHCACRLTWHHSWKNMLRNSLTDEHHSRIISTSLRVHVLTYAMDRCRFISAKNIQRKSYAPGNPHEDISSFTSVERTSHFHLQQPYTPPPKLQCPQTSSVGQQGSYFPESRKSDKHRIHMVEDGTMDMWNDEP